MRSEQVIFDRACKEGDFVLAAAMARAVDHQAAELGIKLKSPSDLYWNMQDDGQRNEAKVLRRLRLDGRVDLDSEDQYDALPKQDFVSLFKLLANAMDAINSAGAIRLRLSRQMFERVDLRCELVQEMPEWFRKAARPEKDELHNVFDHFLAQFSFFHGEQTIGGQYKRPEHESESSIIEFVKVCHENDLISERAVVHAIASEDETVSKCMIDIVGAEPVLKWRSSQGLDVLQEAVVNYKSPFVVQRLLDMGADPKRSFEKYDNVLEMAALKQAKSATNLLKSATWSAQELDHILQGMAQTHNKDLEIKALLQASLARAMMLQIHKGIRP